MFGGNDDNTIGAPRPIDCRRRSIFQDADGLDVIRVEVSHRVGRSRRTRLVIRGNRNTIDYIQRLGIAAHRRSAPHPNLHSLAKLTAAVFDENTSRFALNGLLEGSNRGIANFLRRYGSHRTGQIRSGLATVAYYHSLGQLQR